MPHERFDPAGPSRLARTSCVALVRAVLDPTASPPAVPGLRTAPGALVDRAVAVAATWAAPLLHVTVDVHAAGAVRTLHVHWAASGTVVAGLEGGVDDVRTVRWHEPAAFAHAVVSAAGLLEIAAADAPAERSAAELSRDLAGHGGGQLQLTTYTLVAVGDAPSDLGAPAPLPGTEPVSRALVADRDGLRRLEHTGGDRLRLLPWSGADEQAWLAQVFTGFRDQLGAGPAR